MKDLRTIILAAGKGTRMKSDTPKVLHLLGGRPILQYVLDIAKALGSLKTYVVLGHKSATVQNVLGKDVTPVEQPKMLGTADAVKCVEAHLRSYGGDVLILCADTPLLEKATIKRLVARHKKAKAVCTLLTTVVHNPKGYGRIIRGTSGNVVAIREDQDAVGFERDIAEINVGAYCCRGKDLFRALKEIRVNEKKKEFYLTDIVEHFHEQGLKVGAVETEDPTEGLGINTRVDLAAAEGVMRRRTLERLMLEGVTVVDPVTTHVDAGARVGADTVLYPFTYIEGDVRIGGHCKIGPFARIRSGSRIDDNVEIGNFTEVCRAKVGKGTFMKHFSYIGDATVGENVNLGAGMVTANFDGKEKHLTKIAPGAFIGSGAVLIAPARIGKRAVIGAGSVVPRGKNIPDGSVAVGVPAKIISKKERK